MKPEDWKPSGRVEREYSASIWEAFRRFYEESKERGIPASRLSSSEFLQAYARQAAMRMITGLYWKGVKTWREAARHSGKTALIYRALQQEMRGTVGQRVREIIQEQAHLISSFPQSVAESVATRAMAQQQAGGRSAELARFDGLLLRVARSRAQLIARTQISKASTALTRARSEALNLPWYEWETSSDGRVRPSHKAMQEVLVRFDEPPAPELLVGERSQGHYAAGDIYGCRCYPATVVTLESIRFPAKVYYGGKISRMSLTEFRRINNFKQEAA